MFNLRRPGITNGFLIGAGSPTMGMATSALRVARTSVVGMLTVYGLLELPPWTCSMMMLYSKRASGPSSFLTVLRSKDT